MTSHLDVLLIERRPGIGTANAEVLEAAGHRIHRCYPAPGDPRQRSASATLCTAITEGHCPVDDGVNVALVARKGIAVRPALTEHGVSCAIRAGIPLVEDGSDLFDPYGPWLTARVGPDDDLVTTCQWAAEEGFAPLRDEIHRRIERSLDAARIRPEEVTCRFELDGHHLTVVLIGPPTTRTVQQALGVRVLDAVRTFRRTFAGVDVTFEPSIPATER